MTKLKHPLPVGCTVSAGFTRGVITRVMSGKAGWSYPWYYWIKSSDGKMGLASSGDIDRSPEGNHMNNRFLREVYGG